jgi:hypothetical protein
LDLNESSTIYTMPCTKPHQTWEALEDLEGLEDLAGPEDQDYLKDPLQQYLWQDQQQETPTTGLWETYPKYSTETERMPEPSSTIYWGTSR